MVLWVDVARVRAEGTSGTFAVIANVPNDVTDLSTAWRP
jgi:hypothetical protein